MKNKITALILSLTLFISVFGTFFVSAENKNAADKANDFIGGIVALKQSDGNIQKWINGALSQNPAGCSEWYIMALSQYGDYDFSAYEKSLVTYLSQNSVSSASSRLKYALCLSSVGSRNGYIADTAEEAIGKQGIMSYIFGLHILTNASDGSYTGTVIESILSMQKSDGGWAITGQYSDTDVTAMAVQALSPYYKTDSKVKTAVDKALSALSGMQGADGDYASYGIYNPESTVQVLVALSAMNIDCMADSRFIKNGNTLIDGIEKYRLSNGSFCHQTGGASNENAVSQVFYGMVAYLRFSKGQTPFYVFDNAQQVKIDLPSSSQTENSSSQNTQKPSQPSAVSGGSQTVSSGASLSSEQSGQQNSAGQTGNVQSTADQNSGQNSDSQTAGSDPQTTVNEETNQNAENSSLQTEKTGSHKTGYKLWAILAVTVLAAGAAAVLFFLKKRNIKNFIAVIAAAAIAIVLICVTNFSSADQYYNEQTVSKENASGSVTLTVRWDMIAGKSESEYVPDDGIILDTCEFTIEPEDTVYDILIEAAKKYKIQVDNPGGDQMPYISGINYIYEFDYGDLSGWVYHVNGQSPSVGCGEYKLSDGDRIEWLYSCDLGNDVG